MSRYKLFQEGIEIWRGVASDEHDAYSQAGFEMEEE